MTQLSPSRGQQIVRQTFISLALVIATVCVYLPVRHYGFVNLDDDEFVASNPNIAGGLTWQSVRWAFGAGLNHNDRNVDYWRPLSFLSHALDIQLFGLQPAGHHLMNVGIHAAAAVALCLRGGPVCVASLACRVSGVGHRTQGRVERSVLHADTRRVYPLCPSPVLRAPVPGGVLPVRTRPDVQIDGGNATVRVALAGLLATGAYAMGATSRGR